MRLCPLVLNNGLRHPAVLAQDLTTLDLLSAGRLVVGIGAGWNEPEYRASGIAFDPPAVRIDRMAESIAILRGLFADSPTTYEGRHYCGSWVTSSSRIGRSRRQPRSRAGIRGGRG
jgi:alkanesulfonate monooxygenase SsuD/methylene tetrahydromethanopterin reductase-like flavin-dependent oxidoreductase (luciferase family)